MAALYAYGHCSVRSDPAATQGFYNLRQSKHQLYDRYSNRNLILYWRVSPQLCCVLHFQAEAELNVVPCILQERQKVLLRIADSLEEREAEILAENRADVSEASAKIDDHLMNRLQMDSLKVKQLADGIRSIAKQAEPIRKVLCRPLCMSCGSHADVFQV